MSEDQLPPRSRIWIIHIRQPDGDLHAEDHIPVRFSELEVVR
jgi:hypothetical protein